MFNQPTQCNVMKHVTDGSENWKSCMQKYETGKLHVCFGINNLSHSGLLTSINIRL